MIKFKIEPVKGRVYEGRNLRLWIDRHYQDISASELADVASCCQAALAEVNAERCRCPAHFSNMRHEPICINYLNRNGDLDYCQTVLPDGSNCSHDEACHQPSPNQRGEE